MKDVLKLSYMYKEICEECEHKSQNDFAYKGVDITRLKKKYQLKKRDIETFIKCLKDMEQSEYHQIIYDVSSDLKYIWISDNTKTLREKIKLSNLDIDNLTLSKTIQKRMRNIRNDVIDLDEVPGKIIEKGIRREPHEDIRKKWTTAVVHSEKISVVFGQKQNQLMSLMLQPLGIYYNVILDEYECIYEYKTEICKTNLSNIKKITLLEYQEDTQHKVFDLMQYLKEIQTEEVILRVYKEGKVIEKIKTMLVDNQLIVKQYDNAPYVRMYYKTDDCMQFKEFINSFGQSVVVEKPEKLRIEVLKTIDEALALYEEEI